jgi:hypothetical protein
MTASLYADEKIGVENSIERNIGYCRGKKNAEGERIKVGGEIRGG